MPPGGAAPRVPFCEAAAPACVSAFKAGGGPGRSDRGMSTMLRWLCLCVLLAGSAVAQEVRARIANVTRSQVRYMEPFQILKYEPGQFYKVHHDQTSR